MPIDSLPTVPPMPIRLRPDLHRIEAYRPGRAMAEVAKAYGLDSVIKLASNENPEPPFPEVQAVIAAAASGLNRYPDNARPELTKALADFYGVPEGRIWCGGASNELTLITALSITAPGTSAVYAWPSFSLYQIGTRAGFGEDIAVPLDGNHRHDLAAMRRCGATRYHGGVRMQSEQPFEHPRSRRGPGGLHRLAPRRRARRGRRGPTRSSPRPPTSVRCSPWRQAATTSW